MLAPGQRAVPPPVAESARPTRTAAVWAAVAVGLVVLVLLIVFFVQNQDTVTVRFFGLQGSLALGTTLFIAAVGGGVLVALAGGCPDIAAADHQPPAQAGCRPWRDRWRAGGAAVSR